MKHFVEINFGGKLTEEQMKHNLKKKTENDAMKKTLCENNGINLLYFAKNKYEYPYHVFTNGNKLIKTIYCK